MEDQLLLTKVTDKKVVEVLVVLNKQQEEDSTAEQSVGWIVIVRHLELTPQIVLQVGIIFVEVEVQGGIVLALAVEVVDMEEVLQE